MRSFNASGKSSVQMIARADERKRFQEALLRSAPDYQIALNGNTQERLSRYFLLLNKWNERLHLIAPCSAEEFATRHVLESLTITHHLPPNSSVADIGSGGGLPLIPCLIAREDLRGYLIEASGKKAVFLREALKTTDTEKQASVLNNRFEKLSTPTVNFVTCRALEHFQERLPEIIEWSPHQCTFLLFGGDKLAARLDQLGLTYNKELLPNSERRFLFMVAK